MAMKRSMYDAILSFLLGFSWAFVIIGALLTFNLFYFLGFLTALFFSFSFVFLSLMVILLLETMHSYREGLDETKEQVRLLREIRDEIVRRNGCNES